MLDEPGQMVSLFLVGLSPAPAAHSTDRDGSNPQCFRISVVARNLTGNYLLSNFARTDAVMYALNIDDLESLSWLDWWIIVVKLLSGSSKQKDMSKLNNLVIGAHILELILATAVVVVVVVDVFGQHFLPTLVISWIGP